MRFVFMYVIYPIVICPIIICPKTSFVLKQNLSTNTICPKTSFVLKNNLSNMSFALMLLKNIIILILTDIETLALSQNFS